MSGRLLLFGIDYDDEYRLYQLYNNDELKILYNEFRTYDDKTFNLLMLTFAFIHGADIIQSLSEYGKSNQHLFRLENEFGAASDVGNNAKDNDHFVIGLKETANDKSNHEQQRGTKGWEFEPHWDKHKKNDKTFYYQHICIGNDNFFDRSAEELRFEDQFIVKQ